jgi:hypothetical protein
MTIETSGAIGMVRERVVLDVFKLVVPGYVAFGDYEEMFIE